MIELLKSLKINTVDSAFSINKVSKKNKYFTINKRLKSTIMIKEKGETIYYQNGKKYVCSNSTVIFIPEGSTYKYKITKEGICYQINFDGNSIINEIVEIPINDNEILNLFKKECNQHYKNKEDQHMLLSILYQIFSRLLNLDSNNNLFIKTAIKIINENISDVKLSNFYISNKLNISEIYLRKLFKKHLNTSPHKYIINTRLEKSVELLVNGYSLKNIISIIGYDSVYSFSRAFKNKYGKSPLSLKKEI